MKIRNVYHFDFGRFKQVTKSSHFFLHKLNVAVLVTGILTVSIAGAATCPSNSCNLTVTGTVTATSCDVETTSQNITVPLGDVSIGTFQSVGDTSQAKSFSIHLKDCSDSVSGAKVTFQGNADPDNTALLQLTQKEGAATGVGVEILQGNAESSIALNTQVSAGAISPGENTLTYRLRYKSTRNVVTAGFADAVMFFDLEYQ
ncbi:TPA: fimbrial protein [Klebsiella oxytoca]|jgi:type 1 fimbria pilin|uniref:fimbrial protein n=1 Tax=Klebsiella oxytoca TaxID=571 RepID=UPI00024FEC28|nr:fimbrial protein [Klebsiella oxytoca]EHS88828.1 hypothetical protein HMPREF9687_05190 [Klebsiella oxytoca 10-5243]EHT9908233.1 fimbrial protein [Klebsiella oxytoca]ELD4400748.1 fimbrial protein [Klebsiella oxytoca]HCF8140154.1 fimbrial protein [Klebsiella oxytoca]HEC2030446.1 fimbrial protein [Klebsiella oxytoca]